MTMVSLAQVAQNIEELPVGTIEIHAAEVPDLESVFLMVLRFIESTPYEKHIKVDSQSLYTTLEHIQGHDDQGLFIARRSGQIVGTIAVLIHRNLFSGDTEATELFWWVEPEHRRTTAAMDLLKKSEVWAKDRGVKYLTMIAPLGNERLTKLYERRGFEKIETSYRRSL